MSASKSFARKPVAGHRSSSGPKSVWGFPELPNDLSTDKFDETIHRVMTHPSITKFSSETIAAVRGFIPSDVGRGLLLTGTLKCGSMKLGAHPSEYKLRRFSPCRENDQFGDTSLVYLLSVFAFLANNPSNWYTLKETTPTPMTCWEEYTSFIENHIFPLILSKDFLLAGALTTIFPTMLGASLLSSETDVASFFASVTDPSFMDQEPFKGVSYVKLVWTVHIQMSNHYLDSSLSTIRFLDSLRLALSEEKALQSSLPSVPKRSEVIDPLSFDLDAARRRIESIVHGNKQRQGVHELMTVIATATRTIPTEELKRNMTTAEAIRDEALSVATQIQRHIELLAQPKPAPATPVVKVLPHECPECKKRFDAVFKRAQHRWSAHEVPIPPEERQNHTTPVVPSLNKAMIVEESA